MLNSCEDIFYNSFSVGCLVRLLYIFLCSLGPGEFLKQFAILLEVVFFETFASRLLLTTACA